MNLTEYRDAAKNRAQRRIASRIKNDNLPHANILIDDGAGLDWLLKAPRKPALDIGVNEKPRINHFLCTTGGFFRVKKDKKKCEAKKAIRKN